MEEWMDKWPTFCKKLSMPDYYTEITVAHHPLLVAVALAVAVTVTICCRLPLLIVLARCPPPLPSHVTLACWPPLSPLLLHLLSPVVIIPRTEGKACWGRVPLSILCFGMN